MSEDRPRVQIEECRVVVQIDCLCGASFRFFDSTTKHIPARCPKCEQMYRCREPRVDLVDSSEGIESSLVKYGERVG